jgi:glycosyltransferase involved in cell wall biosynthesis
LISETLIVIPALNEEGTLLKVIQDIRQQSHECQILVVDDGSSDETRKIAIANSDYLVSHPFNLGVGASMRTAFKFAKYNGYTNVVQIDGDGQHKANSISKLIDGLENADIVIGNRFGGSSTYRVDPLKFIGIKFLSQILQMMSHIKVKDPTSGNRAANSRAISVFADCYPTEYLGDTVGSIQLSRRYGLKIIECQVEMEERQGGSPSQSFFNSLKYFIRITLFVLLVGNHQSKRKTYF